MRLARIVLSLIAALTAPALLWAEAPEALVNIAGSRFGTIVRADTEYSPAYAAANVADGRLTRGEGCWFSADWTKLPCALTFELPQAENLRQVALYQADWGGNMYHTRQFAVETSADGKDWQRIATGELPDTSGAKVEVPLPSGRTKYLRILVLTSYNPQQTCGLAEVELLATGLPEVGVPALDLNGKPAPPPVGSHCGLTLVGAETGPQVALADHPGGLFAAVRPGETVTCRFEIRNATAPSILSAQITGSEATVALRIEGGSEARQVLRAGRTELRLPVEHPSGIMHVRLETTCSAGEAGVWWREVALQCGARRFPVSLQPAPASGTAEAMPELRQPLERALIEWDWRMQDGLGTPRMPSTYAQAIERALQRGDELLRDLRGARVSLSAEAAQWAKLREEWRERSGDGTIEQPPGEDLWRRVHWLRREIALKNPLANLGPLAFAKQVPGAFSHQLTQYYGRYARPGGGIFVLEEPGRSMRCRELTAGKLPSGSFQHPEVSFDGKRVLFSFCETNAPPEDTIQGHHGRYYHLYEVTADGKRLKRLTDGPFDDFAPRYMADGKLLFISTRRMGWHRCGAPGCENYTLTVANADGTEARSLSHHETQEWDPALMNDGRIVYTRWDYVDRNAVFFEQLWTTGTDGTRPAILFGNNTLSPVGIFEAHPIPGSQRLMATAGAHHAMTAGSIILVDADAGVDGMQSLTRLTPDAPFPESETTVGGVWHAATAAPYSTPDAERWPGHCYRSSYPLSERYFLAAYSFDGLVGEARGNTPNMFGLYLVDAFGNKELLYRDVAISSLWPNPLRARPAPVTLPDVRAPELGPEGVFVLQNVYASSPALPAGSVKSLRILQVLPKSTPGIDNPPMGSARGAPGKQVLGTVPIAADGSAHFRAPAGVPLAFQALDERGQAVQIMRSLTYLTAGETTSCVGCHESRAIAPPVRAAQAARRAPSVIAPAPDGAKPFSYPILVQPVLNRACVTCHSGAKPAGGIVLTGDPAGHYTASYNALAPRVPVSDQMGLDTLSVPGRYGARGSELMKMLLAGHHKVQLAAGEIERLATWMDANALFYGTFDPTDQARQQRGERISGPKLE